MKIYLDVCCLCRLFDNHSDTRVRLDAEAVLAILKRCSLDWELVTSSAVLYEIGLISDPGKRSQALRLIQRLVRRSGLMIFCCHGRKNLRISVSWVWMQFIVPVQKKLVLSS